MALKSMKVDKNTGGEVSDVCCDNEYPYGLSLHLNGECLDKLGISMAAVGGEVMIAAKAKVISTSESSYEGEEPMRSMALQITDMDIMPAVDNGMAERLYGKEEGGE